MSGLGIRGASHAQARAQLLARLRETTRLRTDDPTDALVALCDAWGALEELIGFYQERVLGEAFLATAEQPASIERLYHSLGHSFAPNAAAVTALAYHLSPKAAGVEAAQRAQRSGGAGGDAASAGVAAANAAAGEATVDAAAAAGAAVDAAAAASPSLGAATDPEAGPAAQANAAAAALAGATAEPRPPMVGPGSTVPAGAKVAGLASSSGAPPTFSTLNALTAAVGASRLPVATPTVPLEQRLRADTTQLELAGTKTGLAVGQPVLIVAADVTGGPQLQWPVLLTSVVTDQKRASTRIGWADALGADAERAADPVVYGFGASAALAGAGAAQWTSLSAAQQLHACPALTWGGLAISKDDGQTWTQRNAGVKPGTVFSAVGVYDDVLIVATADGGLLRAQGEEPLAAATIAGGGRRRIGFLGGTRARMLATGASGTVLQSFDDGQTWSPPPVHAPVVDPKTKTVTTYQLPNVMVRGAAAETSSAQALLAATDAGGFGYFPVGESDPVTGSGWGWLPQPRFRDPIVSFAATSVDGRSVFTAGTTKEVVWWAREVSSLALSPPALAVVAPVPSGTGYVGTESGVQLHAGDQKWAHINGTPPNALPAGDVTALVRNHAGNRLLAGTAQGLFTTSDGGGSWHPADVWPVFSIQDASPVPGKVGAEIRAAFTDQGIVLGPDAALSPTLQDDGAYDLQDGQRAFRLVPADAGPWTVWQVGALGAISALGQDDQPGGWIVAAGAPLASAADDWPGFAVHGPTVEIAPQQRSLVAGGPALIEQRADGGMDAVPVQLSTVEQASEVCFGRETALTRLTVSPGVPPGTFPRRSTTVWAAATPLALFAAPDTRITAVHGSTVELAAPLVARLPPKRLGTISGSPVAVAAAPLGGVLRIPGVAGAAPVPRPGPAQADVLGVAAGPTGIAYLATTEGPMEVGEKPGEFRLILNRWPADEAGAVAVAVVGSSTLMGGRKGLLRLEATTTAWQDTGITGDVAALAASAGHAAVALADGSLRTSTDGQGQTWSARPAPPEKPVALAVGQGRVLAATAAGVLALPDDGGTWSSLGHPAPGEAIVAIAEADGTVWAAGAWGIAGHDGKTWTPVLDPAAQIAALAVDPLDRPVAAGMTGVWRFDGGAWASLDVVPGAPVTSVAIGPDLSIWLGTRAALALEQGERVAPRLLAMQQVLPEVGVSAADLSTLGQGALPAALLDALTAAGRDLDSRDTVVEGAGFGAWRVRCGQQLDVVALRTDGGRNWVAVYTPPIVLYATAPCTVEDGLEAWHVRAEGATGVLRVPHDRRVLLPAGTDAPSYAETITVVGTQDPVTRPTLTGTLLELAAPLRHIYDPATTLVNLNVVSAAQGQPVSTPIGSGDPAAIHQSFRVPTPVAAVGATPGLPDAPVASTLSIAVAGQPWHAVASLAQARPDDPVYVVTHNADGTATVHFGDGVHGARLPAGRNNVVATYLQGGGPAGQAPPASLIQPLDRPQMVVAVHNPVPATLPPAGTAHATRTAGIRALDRLVTLGDYEDVALAQPGVASAAAQLIGGRAVVVTVAAHGPRDAALTAVRRAVGTTTATGLDVAVVAARPVGVWATVRVIGTGADLLQHVRVALAGLAARRPGAALRASELLRAAGAVRGARSVEIVRWGKHGQQPGAPAELLAAPARWPADDPAPTSAELLTIDGAAGALIVVRGPA